MQVIERAMAALTRAYDAATGPYTQITAAGPSRSPTADMMPMRALYQLPYVYACVKAISDDVSMLPRFVGRIEGDGKLVRQDDPGMALIAKPSPGTSTTELIAQLVADYVLTGSMHTYSPKGIKVIMRVHPEQIRGIRKKGTNWFQAYEITVDGKKKIVPASEISSSYSISVGTGDQEVWGFSPIQPLQRDLKAEINRKTHTVSSSEDGYPMVVFSSDAPVKEKTATDLVKKFVQTLRGRGQAFFVGKGFTWERTGFSPKDMQNEKQSESVREATLAVLGVPGVRLGLVSADYSSGRQQIRGYWQTTVGPVMLRVSDVLSVHLRPGNRLVLSTANVEELQASATERIENASTLHTTFGAGASDALRYFGFFDPPVGNNPPTSETPTSRRPGPAAEEPQEGRKHLAARAILEQYAGSLDLSAELEPMDELRTLAHLASNNGYGVDVTVALDVISKAMSGQDVLHHSKDLLRDPE